MNQLNLMSLYCPKCFFVTRWPDKHWKKCLKASVNEIKKLKVDQRSDIFNNYIPNRVIYKDKLQAYADSNNIEVHNLQKVRMQIIFPINKNFPVFCVY